MQNMSVKLTNLCPWDGASLPIFVWDRKTMQYQWSVLWQFESLSSITKRYELCYRTYFSSFFPVCTSSHLSNKLTFVGDLQFTNSFPTKNLIHSSQKLKKVLAITILFYITKKKKKWRSDNVSQINIYESCT